MDVIEMTQNSGDEAPILELYEVWRLTIVAITLRSTLTQCV